MCGGARLIRYSGAGLLGLWLMETKSCRARVYGWVGRWAFGLEAEASFSALAQCAFEKSWTLKYNSA